MSTLQQPLTLFEHETKAYDWTDHDLQALARLAHITGGEVLRATLLNGKRALQATHQVGVFRFGQTTVQVLPKIYRSHGRAEHDTEREHNAARNLLYLLHYASQVPLRESALAPLAQQQQNWFEGLITIFSTHLLEAWQRGPYRFYQDMQDDLPLLKGKLDIGHHIRHPERRHRFAVTYDEFTADVSLNRIFRFVVERLWRVTRSEHNRMLLERLRQWMEDVRLLPTLTVEDTENIALTRLNQHFAPLLDLARLFLRRETLQLAMGDTMLFAFTLNMNQLFETFLTQFIYRHRYEILPVELQSCTLHPQSRGITRYLAIQEGSGKAHFYLKPDLVIHDSINQRFPLLVDMKYKHFTDTGIAREDFYQMYAYAHRYDCPHILLLYPQTAEMEQPLLQTHRLMVSQKTITAATIDMRGNLQRSEE